MTMRPNCSVLQLNVPVQSPLLRLYETVSSSIAVFGFSLKVRSFASGFCDGWNHHFASGAKGRPVRDNASRAFIAASPEAA